MDAPRLCCTVLLLTLGACDKLGGDSPAAQSAAQTNTTAMGAPLAAAPGTAVIPTQAPFASRKWAAADLPATLRKLSGIDGDKEACREYGGIEYGNGFIRQADFNKDGKPDFVLDLNERYCREAASLFCGNTDCGKKVFLSQGAGYQYASRDDEHYPVSIRSHDGKSVLVVDRAPSSRKTYWGWNGNKFTVLSDLTNTTAPKANARTFGATVDLGKYVGRYSFDKIDGAIFAEQPTVIASVSSIVSDKAIRQRVLDAEGTGSEITRNGAWVVYELCENHSCNVHNWKIMITSDGKKARVCHFEIPRNDPDYLAAEWRRPHSSNWFYEDGSRRSMAGNCASSQG